MRQPFLFTMTKQRMGLPRSRLPVGENRRIDVLVEEVVEQGLDVGEVDILVGVVRLEDAVE
jgi:hypothetical protein